MADCRIETEVKFLVRRTMVAEAISAGGVEKRQISQVYLDPVIVKQYKSALELPDEPFEEWRLRRMDEKCIFTAKGGTGISRREFEREIDSALFNEMYDAAVVREAVPLVRKTRYIVSAGDWMIEADDYHETGAGKGHYDFLTCEIEFSSEALAKTFLAQGPETAIPFLEGAVNLTGYVEFANRSIARHGFPAKSFDALVTWLEMHTS